MLRFDLIGVLGSQKVVATGQIDFPELDIILVIVNTNYVLVHLSRYGSVFCMGILTDM